MQRSPSPADAFSFFSCWVEASPQPQRPCLAQPRQQDVRTENLLFCGGPAAAVFRRRHRLGYDDGLGDRVVGTFANWAGGQTPWGTVLSTEENIQTHVVEVVHADGSSPSPGRCPFRFDGEPLIVTSGGDRHGGHLYCFISAGRVRNPMDPANSKLLEQGRLETARFHSDGSGLWIPLLPQTPIDPLLPSYFARFDLPALLPVPHSDRSQAGAELRHRDAHVEANRLRFHSLADLYVGGGDE